MHMEYNWLHMVCLHDIAASEGFINEKQYLFEIEIAHFWSI